MAKTTALSWTRSNRVIGKGSFGTVSIGTWKSDGRIFAVKSVEQSVGFHRQIECLENEIRILRSLKSPYVVGFLGDDVSGESPTMLFRNLHMEYLPGGTVADDPTGAGDEKLLRARTRCIVLALSYVHSKGIVHCDVKGRNVLIGSNPTFVKLADFGSATEIPGAAAGSVAPRGSPLWMAPEVVRGEYQGPESDVWSIGCTVIEMVTGKPAWEDFGVDTVSRIGFSDEMPEIPIGFSELGRDFLGKCLRRDSSERWSCDRLLQHPFLAVDSPDIAGEGSPRCVLDWVNGDFDDNEEEEILFTGAGGREIEISSKGIIQKISTSEWPDWDSDSWFPVRSFCSEAAPAPESCEEEGVGVEWEYENLRGVKGEMEGTSLEYSKFIKDNHGKFGAEYSNPGGQEFPERPRNNCCGGCGDGGLSFRRWRSERCEITTITSWTYLFELILCYYFKILMKQLMYLGTTLFYFSLVLKIFSSVLLKTIYKLSINLSSIYNS